MYGSSTALTTILLSETRTWYLMLEVNEHPVHALSAMEASSGKLYVEAGIVIPMASLHAMVCDLIAYGSMPNAGRQDKQASAVIDCSEAQLANQSGGILNRCGEQIQVSGAQASICRQYTYR